MILKS